MQYAFFFLFLLVIRFARLLHFPRGSSRGIESFRRTRVILCGPTVAFDWTVQTEVQSRADDSGEQEELMIDNTIYQFCFVIHLLLLFHAAREKKTDKFHL